MQVTLGLARAWSRDLRLPDDLVALQTSSALYVVVGRDAAWRTAHAQSAYR